MYMNETLDIGAHKRFHFEFFMYSPKLRPKPKNSIHNIYNKDTVIEFDRRI